MLDAIEHQKIGKGKGDDIHQPVILKPEPADLEYHWAGMLWQVLPPVPERTHEKMLRTPFNNVSQSYGILFFMSKKGHTFSVLSHA